MAKIKCTSTRQPWLDGVRYQNGEVAEVSAELAKIAISTGFFEGEKNVSERKDNDRGREDTGSPKPRGKRNTKGD